MAPDAGGHDKGSSVTAIQLVPDAGEQLEGAWPRRSPERGQSDRLFLLQARRSGASALKADPNHVLTWQCDGLWQVEQGNRDQAQENAERPGIAAGPFLFDGL
jgi:hypothetical protein